MRLRIGALFVRIGPKAFSNSADKPYEYVASFAESASHLGHAKGSSPAHQGSRSATKIDPK
jgi:hypothetical protein